ncbi:MAG: hypothetical protein ACJ740_11415 [Gaiellales bacterium]
MNVRGVDPRDIEREVKAVCRVHFWSAGRTLSDEFELTDAADVHEVLRWIDANADGREVEALVVVDGCDVGRRAVPGSIAAYLIGPLDHTGAAA